MSPSKIADALKRILQGGPNAPDRKVVFRELIPLADEAMGAAREYTEALASGSPDRIRNAESRAIGAHQRLATALRPVTDLGEFGRLYLEAIKEIQRNLDPGGIQKLGDRLAPFDKDSTDLMGQTVLAIGGVETPQALRLGQQWVAGRNRVIPASHLGLGKRLETLMHHRLERALRHTPLPYGPVLTEAPDLTEQIHWQLLASGLPDREREILSLLTSGFNDDEIAQHLGLSASTIRWYRGRLRKRLGLTSRR